MPYLGRLHLRVGNVFDLFLEPAHGRGVSQSHLLHVLPAHPRLQVRRRVHERVQQEVCPDRRPLSARLVDASMCNVWEARNQGTAITDDRDVSLNSPAVSARRVMRPDLTVALPPNAAGADCIEVLFIDNILSIWIKLHLSGVFFLACRVLLWLPERPSFPLQSRGQLHSQPDCTMVVEPLVVYCIA